jgi:hypothetical protein
MHLDLRQHFLSPCGTEHSYGAVFVPDVSRSPASMERTITMTSSNMGRCSIDGAKNQSEQFWRSSRDRF